MGNMLELQEPVGMLAETATELLCTAPLTNKKRKECWAAREKHWISAQECKPIEVKLAARFERATLQQLGKWHRRAEKRYLRTQNQYRKICAAEEEALKDVNNRLTDAQKVTLQSGFELRKSQLQLFGGTLETILECLESALTKRTELPHQRFLNQQKLFKMFTLKWHQLTGAGVHWDPESLFQ